jgi:hypothetical protein
MKMNIIDPKVDEAYLVNGGGCGNGKSCEVYYRSGGKASNGKYVTGTGPTKAEAEKDARERLVKIEKFLLMPPREQLREIIKEENLSWSEQQDALRALIKIVLEE